MRIVGCGGSEVKDIIVLYDDKQCEKPGHIIYTELTIEYVEITLHESFLFVCGSFTYPNIGKILAFLINSQKIPFSPLTSTRWRIEQATIIMEWDYLFFFCQISLINNYTKKWEKISVPFWSQANSMVISPGLSKKTTKERYLFGYESPTALLVL